MCDFTCDEDLLVSHQYHLYVRTTLLLIHPMPSPLSRVWVRRQLSGVHSLSTMWVLKPKFRSSGLTASTFYTPDYVVDP